MHLRKLEKNINTTKFTGYMEQKGDIKGSVDDCVNTSYNRISGCVGGWKRSTKLDDAQKRIATETANILIDESQARRNRTWGHLNSQVVGGESNRDSTYFSKKTLQQYRH